MSLDLSKYIRDVHDFPKKGIVFKDITPLLSDPRAMDACLEALVALVGEQKIDKVVGVEARGFFFGTLLAKALGAGFVPVRKPGKLPYATYKESYALEYGEDVLEIHQDAIIEGERVLIHDDVLATGGTAAAVCKLVGKCGGSIVQCNFLMELTFLKGTEKLLEYPIKSLWRY